MRYDVAIPQFTGPAGVDRAALAGYLARAEQLGFTGAWTLEQAIGPTPLLSPLETLGYAAALSERIRLGVGVIVTSVHSPVHLAGSVATLDLLSHGRIDLGISAGGGFRNFEAFGVDRSTFVGRFNDGLALMKDMWSAGDVDHHGPFFELTATIEPKPVQRPHPPIWFGAGARTSIRRAVRSGDAFLGAGSTSTERFAGQAHMLRAELDAAGRDPATFPVGKRVYLAVDDDPARARDTALAALRRVYGDSVPGIADCPVTGTAEQVATGLAAVIDAGAEMILLDALGHEAEQLEQLAAEVLPLLTTR